MSTPSASASQPKIVPADEQVAGPSFSSLLAQAFVSSDISKIFPSNSHTDNMCFFSVSISTVVKQLVEPGEIVSENSTQRLGLNEALIFWKDRQHRFKRNLALYSLI